MMDEHVSLMARWLSDPRLLEYYGGRDDPQTDETIRTENIQKGGQENFIVMSGDEAIGYLQFYLVHPKWMDVYGFESDEAASVFGMDVFVGDLETWGTGFGSRMVAGAAGYLVGDRGATRIFLDPYVSDTRAIRAYEKAGFKKVCIVPQKELHEGTWQDAWLMEYRAG